MRETSGRSQLVLRWTDELRWDQLPASVRIELRQVLRTLLQDAAVGDEGQGEASDAE